MQLSKNFHSSEFACKCGQGCNADGTAISTELIAVLELIRAHFGYIAPGGEAKVVINSGHRCITHNRTVGKSSSSQHLAATAADVVVLQKNIRGQWSPVPTALVHEWIRDMFPKRYGFGVYDTFNHIDVRPEGARWDYRS